MCEMIPILSESDFDNRMDQEVIPFLSSIGECGYLPIDSARGDAGRYTMKPTALMLPAGQS